MGEGDETWANQASGTNFGLRRNFIDEGPQHYEMEERCREI
jgi:hypothetical protein